MNRRDFLLRTAWGALLPFASKAHENAVNTGQPLPVADPTDRWGKGLLVSKPGRYYLPTNHIQRAHFTIEGMKPSAGSSVTILAVESGSVDIDLRGHTLGGDLNTRGIGILSVPSEMAEQYPRTFPNPNCVNVRDVSIRNGKVDLARGVGNGSGLSAVRNWLPEEQTGDGFTTQTIKSGPVRKGIRRMGPERDAPIAPLEPNAFPGYEGQDRQGNILEIVRVSRQAVEYIRSDYLFENLEIRTHLIGVAVEGSHNVFRNCVIDSAGLAALFLAGPNVTIENCTIRLRVQSEDSARTERSILYPGFASLPDEVAFPPRAAIVLRDGSNAVIRNNEIRIDYPPFERRPNSHCILVQDGAKSVLIEGNTFVNLEGEPVTLSEGADVIMRDSKFEKRWFSY